MDSRCAVALPENARVFFGGVVVRPEALVSTRLAARWRAAAPEWLRPLAAPAAWRRWAIDFPPDSDRRSEPEWAWRRFVAGGARLPPRAAGAELRIALAKTERYLATPAARRQTDWRWLPGHFLPQRGLVVLVRDDGFLAAVAASYWMEVWRQAQPGPVGLALWRAFPFPWAPDTPRSALSREQEDRRTSVVQAARAAGVGAAAGGGNFPTADLTTAVAAAYGWPGALAGAEALARLQALNAQRAAGSR